MNRENVIANLSAEVNRLMNQNIRLEEERAEIWRRNRDTEASRDTKAAIIAELKAENESLRKDAERYRWLCSQGWFDNALESYGGLEILDCDDYIDASIDAAMGQGEQS